MKILKGILPICLIAAVTGTGLVVLAQEEQTEPGKEANCFEPPRKCKGKKGFRSCKMQGAPPPPMMMQQGMRPMQGPPMGKGGPDKMRCGGKGCGKGRFDRGPKMDSLMMLEIENPAKAEELKKLKESNPEEFGKALRSAEKEMFEKIKTKMNEYKKLVREYRKNKNSDLQEKIRASLLEQYDVNLKIKEKMLQKMQEKAKKAQEDLEQAKSLKDKLVDMKLELLTLPPDLKDWVKMGCGGPKGKSGPKGPGCPGGKGGPKGEKPQGPPTAK